MPKHDNGTKESKISVLVLFSNWARTGNLPLQRNHNQVSHLFQNIGQNTVPSSPHCSEDFQELQTSSRKQTQEDNKGFTGSTS